MNKSLVHAFLEDEDDAIGVGNENVKKILTSETGCKILLEFILLEKLNEEEESNSLTEEEVKRSYWAMTVCCDNLKKNAPPSFSDNLKSSLLKGHSLFDSDKAGLVAKQLLHAYSESDRFRAHHPHLNKLLLTLLSTYPSSVLSASCAGGANTTNVIFSSLLKYDVSFLISLVLTGCCLNYKDEGNQQQTQENQFGTKPENTQPISRGLHRKFVRGLIEWKLFEQIVNYITLEEDQQTATYAVTHVDRESACDALITIVRFIDNPSSSDTQNESQSTPIIEDKALLEAHFGEDYLLHALGKNEILEKLTQFASGQTNSIQTTVSSSALVRILELATGSKNGKKQGAQAAPQISSVSGPIQRSRLVHWGVGQSMYETLFDNMPILVKSLSSLNSEGCNDSGDLDSKNLPVFTSRRLNIITIIAEMLEFGYRSIESADSFKLLETLNEINIEDDSLQSERKKPGDTINLWLYLNHLLFIFPENNLFHIQYYRIFFSALRWNHEQTLRLFLQKSKFVTKAISALRDPASPFPQGILLKCLNALRLQCKCLGPKSYLRHYLESHDVWKSFKEQMLQETMQQQLPGLGLIVPKSDLNMHTANSNVTNSEPGIDLRSLFANGLGFEGVEDYVPETNLSLESDMANVSIETNEAKNTGKKNKNKKKKKGKKKK